MQKSTSDEERIGIISPQCFAPPVRLKFASRLLEVSVGERAISDTDTNRACVEKTAAFFPPSMREATGLGGALG